MVGHVFPEAENVDSGLFQHLREHGDEELRVGLHHLLHKGRIVVEQRAQRSTPARLRMGPKNPPQRSARITKR